MSKEYKQLSVEELLKPRYKVIADYPGNKDFPAGSIIDSLEPWSGGWMKSIEDCQGRRDYATIFFDLYPHLFKKMEWWEDRKEDEMPEYVKFVKNYMYYKKGQVFKYETWGEPKNVKIDLKAGFIHFRTGNGKNDLHACPASFDQFKPATKAEYDLYNSNKGE